MQVSSSPAVPLAFVQPVVAELRAIVVAGLLPLLLEYVTGIAPRGRADERALVLLGRSDDDGRLTILGHHVAHQLAALRDSGDLPAIPAITGWWGSVLIAHGAPSPYGQHLLAWLRAGTMLRRCAAHECGGAVVGVMLAGGRRVLACAEHRDGLARLDQGALDRALAGVRHA
jgi:hypothetical protein